MEMRQVKISTKKPFINFIFLSVFWTALILILGWNYYRQVYKNSVQIVKSSAIDGFRKDLVYRQWPTNHGGVYVPETVDTPASPWLSHIPERDIISTSGKKLTLVNPAYMTRQVNELAAKNILNLGHITSLTPIRQLNAPDDWERKALTTFENGTTETASVEFIKDVEYFRYMRPMITEEGCLKCHSHQGYQVGDIRGGISVSIPWLPFKKQLKAHLIIIIMSYGGIWLIGIIALVIVMIRIQNDIQRRIKIEDQLRKSELKYKALFENMNQGMALHEIILNSAGHPIDYRFIEINDSFEKITGLKREKIIGKSVMEVMPNTELSWIEKYGQVVATGLPLHYENYARELDRYYEVIAFRTQPKQFAVITTDITERKKYENNIKIKNSELQKINAEKDKFFSIISHDLMSPFNSILGFSKAVVEDINVKDCVEAGKHADIVWNSSNRALKLLKNLLDWSRVKTGRMVFNPEDFNLNEVIMEISDMFNDISAQKSIKIDNFILADTSIYADKAMISTIIRNLISNAIKFTMPGGEIKISAELNQNKLTVSVEDTGVGIPSDGIAKIFLIEDNYSTPGTQNEDGTGLGLMLCKEFAEKHGCIIWVESEVGVGSTFSFTIPVK
jgi:two-component system, chemotaxis family, sensor kinase Cph1